MRHAKLGVVGRRLLSASGPGMPSAGGRSWTTVDWKRRLYRDCPCYRGTETTCVRALVRTAVQIVARSVESPRGTSCWMSSQRKFAGWMRARNESGSKRDWRRRSVQALSTARRRISVLSNGRAPEVEVVNVLRRAAEPAIAGHELLADHLVGVEAEGVGDATLDAREVALRRERECHGFEDRIEAIGDLEFEGSLAAGVLVANRP